MSWIKSISYAEADPKLKRIYNRIKGPEDYIDNVLTIHGQRPHTLIGHMTLYKSVLHHSDNSLPKWYLEALGVYVSYLNNCDYCVQHHFQGFKKLMSDETKSASFLNAVQHDKIDTFFDLKFRLGMKYAKSLTLNPTALQKSDINELKKSGFTEGEILEINQVSAYFNYVNRMVIGLGVSTDGDIIGLSPNQSDDPSNWTHK